MQVDDTFLWDYSLFFVSILYDYYQETKDLEIVKELWPTAYCQITLALKDMKDGVLDTESNPMAAFIDWKDGLDRQAAASGRLDLLSAPGQKCWPSLREMRKAKAHIAGAVRMRP